MNDPRHPSLDELAAGEIDSADVDVLARVARIFDLLDRVPAGLVDRINFGLTLEALHAEIAELQRSGDLVGVRSDADTDVRTVTFTSSTLSAMITMTPTSGDRVRIDGWIAPSASMPVELRVGHETRHVVADEQGRFVFDDVPRGLAQFVLRPDDGESGRPVVTPAVEI